jgi:hypothetical protein
MRAFGVDRDPMTLIIRHIDGFVDGMNRTRWDAGAAIDAHVGIDIGALLVSVEAFDGANRHAIGEAAEMAVISDDVRHISRDSSSETNNRRTERIDGARVACPFQRSPECGLCLEPRKCHPIYLHRASSRERG